MLWHIEAQRKRLEITLNNMFCFRSAQAQKEDYQSVVNQIKFEMNQLVIGKKDSIKMNLEELKRRG